MATKKTTTNKKKAPLKNPGIKEDKLAYRYKAVDLFLGKM